ncbi:MAG TPA: AsmA-like C-terminal domain-containing protein [Rhizomicrobium sp.]|nr:AsmA-like C-terminal domain-containing protein [Rhizomicrobium sp.]
MVQDRPIDASRPKAARTTLSEAWNATFIGRYVKSHHISRTALVISAIGVAVLFFLVGAVLRLFVGPISLGPLSGQISEALAQALPGITVKYDQAAVEWSRDQGRVNLVVLGARVFDSRGRIIAQAPKADIDLAAQPFLKGDIVVRRITLVGVQLTMVRDTDGTLRLGVERDLSQKDIISRITDAINKNSSSASSLESFAVRDARLAFKDENTGLFLVAPRADVKIANAGPDLIASLDADVEITGVPAHLVGQIHLPPATGPVTGRLEVHHLDIAALGHNAPMFKFLQPVAMTGDFASNFAIQGTHLLKADFTADGAGSASFVGIRKPVHVKSLHLAGAYDSFGQTISIRDASLISDQLTAHVVGGLALLDDPKGAIDAIAVDFTADKTALSVPGTFQQPLFLPLAQLKGRYVPATHDIFVDHFSATGGALVLNAAGHIALVDNKSPVTELKGSLAALNVHDLVHYWPLGMGEGARDWIAANISTGSVGPIQFETHLPAGAFDLPKLPDGALLMTFPITNAELSYVHGLTRMTGVFANARLTGNTFSADIAKGRIGMLAVSNGHAVIPDLSAPDSAADIAAHVDGSVTDILKLTDLKPLGYPTRFGIDPNTTMGKAAVDLKFHVPLRKNLNVDDIDIGIKAVTSAFGISLGKATRLSDGTMTFDIDNTHLHAYGTTALATSKMQVDWVEEFRATGPVTTKVQLKGLLDQAGRDALGMHAIEYVRGPVGVNGTLTGRRGQLVAGDLQLDLTPALLAVDLVGISKPAGFPASAHALLAFGPHSVLKSANIALTGPSVNAAMTLAFDDNGTLVSLNAPSVKSGASNDFAFTLTRAPNLLDISVRGHSLDGTKIANRGSASANGGSGPAASKPASDVPNEPFHIDAKLDRLVLRNNVTIAPFALDIAGTADRPSALTLSGKYGKGGSVDGTIQPAGSDRKLVLTATDFGTMARGLFGFASIKGGRLELQATLHGPAVARPEDAAANDYEGVVHLKDFRLLNQPFLARLFSAGSLIGFGNLMQNNGIAVDDLRIPFTAKNGVLGIVDAHASGPAIGVSAEGYIDRPKNEIALKGTLVPLFGLNSVLGVIPLVGDLLVSKPGEGIIGMTYSATGDADEPKISINPLSLVAPGILRRIFEGKMPNVANAPSNAPPQAATPPAPK